jgi:hypothetical protein
VGVEAREPRKRPTRIALPLQAMTAEVGRAGAASPTTDSDQVSVGTRALDVISVLT